MGPLIHLFWTSGDVCSGFQSSGGFLARVDFLLAHFLACILFLRFTSGVKPADCIEVSMAAKTF